MVFLLVKKFPAWVVKFEHHSQILAVWALSLVQIHIIIEKKNEANFAPCSVIYVFNK